MKPKTWENSLPDWVSSPRCWECFAANGAFTQVLEESLKDTMRGPCGPCYISPACLMRSALAKVLREAPRYQRDKDKNSLLNLATLDKMDYAPTLKVAPCTGLK